MQYLRNSEEIKNKIAELFTGDEEKWAIVAFVEIDAADLLPKNVKNLNVVCWPKPLGTHPDGIRGLADKGANVYFCDRLHTKMYWKKGKGVIIGSANLSRNALGEGGLHEYAYYCEDPSFDIKGVLKTLDRRPVDAQALEEVEVEHNRKFRQVEEDPSGGGARAVHCSRTPAYRRTRSRLRALR